MNKRLPTLLGLALLLLATATRATAQDPAQGAAEQSPNQVQQQQQAQRGPSIYPMLAAGLIEMGVPVIDVRSEAEIAETGTLGGAVQIAHTETDAIAEFIGDRNRAVVLYCGSGRRVGLVIDALRERGYHGMVNAGGYEDLRQALEGENEG